jgi:hypothetical protein
MPSALVSFERATVCSCHPMDGRRERLQARGFWSRRSIRATALVPSIQCPRRFSPRCPLANRFSDAGIHGIVGFQTSWSGVWKKWLSRRDRRKRFLWSRFTDLLERYPLPAARIIHRYINVSKARP